MIQRPHRAMQWTLILILVGCVAGAAVVMTADSVLAPIGDDAATLSHRTLPADIALEQTSIQARVGQVAFLDAIQATNAADRGAAITQAEQAGRLQDTQWAAYMKIAGHTTEEQPLQAAIKAAFMKSRYLGGVLIGSSPTDPSYAANLHDERQQSALGLSLLDAIQARFYDPKVTGDSGAVVGDIANGRTRILIAAAAAFLAFLGVGAVMVRRVRRDGQTADRDARVRAVEHRRSDIETRLQRALEMESREDATYDLIRQALGTVAGGRAVELLVADSSQAHFRQVLSTVDVGSAPVGSPRPASVPPRAAVKPGASRTATSSTPAHTCGNTPTGSGPPAFR